MSPTNLDAPMTPSEKELSAIMSRLTMTIADPEKRKLYAIELFRWAAGDTAKAARAAEEYSPSAEADTVSAISSGMATAPADRPDIGGLASQVKGGVLGDISTLDPFSKNAFNMVTATGNTRDRAQIGDQFRSRSIGTAVGPSFNQILELSRDPRSVFHKTLGLTEDEKKQANTVRVAQGLEKIPLGDTLAWASYAEGALQNQTYLKQGPDVFRAGDVSKSVGVGLIEGVTFGSLHAVDAALQAAGWTDKSYWTDVTENSLYLESKYTRIGKGAGELAGFFIPGGFGGKLAKGLIGAAKKGTTNLAGEAITKKVAKSAVGKVLGKAGGAVEKAVVKGATVATAVTGKVVFEYPEQLLAKGVGKAVATGFGKGFIKGTAKGLESAGLLPKLSALRQGLAKLPLIRDLDKTGEAAIRSALSQTITQAWRTSRSTTIRSINKAAEQDAVSTTIQMFAANVSRELSKALGEPIESEIVRKAALQATKAFAKRLQRKGKGSTFRQMLSSPLAFSNRYATHLGNLALTGAEGAAGMSIHSQIMQMNAMLGHSAVMLESTETEGMFERGHLYLSGAWELMENQNMQHPWWKTAIIGALFHTGATTKFIPKTMPFFGGRTFSTGIFGRAEGNFFESAKKYLRGPKITEQMAENIVAKEFAPAHQLIVEQARIVLGMKSGDSIASFLSRTAAESSQPGKLVKLTKGMFNRYKGIAKQASKMTPEELAYTGAMAKRMRANFESPLDTMRRGQGRRYHDGFGFDELDLRILKNTKKYSKAEVSRARAAVADGLERNFDEIWSKYRGRAASEAARDFANLAFVRFPAVFFSTGGIGMMQEWKENGMSAELFAGIMQHGIMSLWAANSPRFTEGVHFAPEGWHRGRKLVTDKDILPGWSDARIELAQLERELFYLGAGSTEFFPSMGYKPVERTINGVVSIRSNRELVNSFTKRMSELTQEVEADRVLAPGQKPLQWEGLNEITSTEREHMRDIIAAMAATGLELGPMFHIDGKSPADGEVWLKALDSNESRRDMFLARAAKAMKDVLAERDIIGHGEELNFTALVRSVQAADRQVNTKIRGAAFDALMALRDEQVAGGTQSNESQMVHQFRFSGERGDEVLNDRINNFFNIAKLFELGVGDMYMASEIQLPGGKIVDDKSMLDVGKTMSRDRVRTLLEHFEAGLKKLDIHESLTLDNIELPMMVSDNIQVAGRSLASELMAYDQPLPLLSEQEGILTRSRVLEAGRAGGLLEYVDGKYILKYLHTKMLNGLSDKKRQELLALHYFFRADPEVQVMTDNIYKDVSHLNITQESELGIWSSHTFEASEHQSAGTLKRFTFQTGLIGAMRAAGIPLHSYNYAKSLVNEVVQHRLASLTDNEVAFWSTVEDINHVVRTDKGRLLRPPTTLVTRAGARADLKEGQEHQIQSLIDAARETYHDQRATGELRYDVVSSQGLLDHASKALRDLRGRDLTDAELMQLNRAIDITAVKAYETMGQKLIDKGIFDGWATHNGKLGGKPTEIILQARDQRSSIAQLQTVLQPLSEATTAKERRFMVEEMRRKLTDIKATASTKLVKRIDWFQKRLTSILERNDARAIRDLHFLLKGTDVLTLTQAGSRRDVRIDFSRLKNMNLEKVLDRLEIIDFSDMQTADIRSRYLDKMEQAPSELERLLPRTEPHLKGNSLQDLLIDIGIGVGNDTSKYTIRELFQITKNAQESPDLWNVDLLRDYYSNALRAGAADITGESQGDPIGDHSPLKTRQEIFDKIEGMTDADIMSIFHNTSNMKRYASIEPGATTHASMTAVRSPVITEAGEAVMEHVPKSTFGNSSVKWGSRKHNGIDNFSEATGLAVHELGQVNRENGASLLFSRSERAFWAKEYLENGLSAIDPSDKADHVAYRVDENGNPHINRVSTIELTDSRSLLVEIPYTKPELQKFRNELVRMRKELIEVVGEESQRVFLERVNEVVELIDGKLKTKAEETVVAETGVPDAYDLYGLIKTGQMSATDLSNIYRMMLRVEIFGEGAMSEAVGTNGVKNNKRIKQILSNSAQAGSGQGLDYAVQIAVRRADALAEGPAGGDKYMRDLDNITDGNGRDREARVLTVSEESLAQIMGVEQLDGNMIVHPAYMDLLVQMYGHDPASAVFGTLKAFTHGGVRRDGSISSAKHTTKPLLAVPSERVQTLMEKLGVAMILPESSVKIGQRSGEFKFGEIMVDGISMPVHRAAFEVAKRGGNVARAEGKDVINMRPEDIRFQQMPHPDEHGATITGQMALDWHPQVVSTFNDMFKSEDMLNTVTALMGDIDLQSMALSRALMTNKDLNPITTQGDIVHRRASMMNQMLLRTPYASPALFFRKPLENRVLSLVKKNLFKGHTDTGSKAMFSPDETNALNSMESIFAYNDFHIPAKVAETFFGALRTVRLVRSPSGRIRFDAETGKPMTEPFTPEMATEHQARSMGFQKDAGNFYNTPSDGVEPIAGRESRWVDGHILGKGKDHPLHQIIEEWYAGGDTGVNRTKMTPLQELFTHKNISPLKFDKAIEGLVEVFKEILQNGDVSALTRTGGIIETKIEALNASFTGDQSVRLHKLANELSMFTRNVLHGEGLGEGLAAGGLGQGHIKEGMLKNLVDMMFGTRRGDYIDEMGKWSWERDRDGYQYEDRMKTADGKIEQADNDGKTPVTYGQLKIMQRSPSAKPNDTIPTHGLGYLREKQGRQLVVGRKDSAGIMEADNDGDKANYMTSMPKEIFAEALRMRNIMGGVGIQKGDVNEPGYTYIVGKGVDEHSSTESGNQYLRYIADQAQAEFMKGQMISVRSAVSKMIADNVKLTYKEGNREVVIQPSGRYNDVMESGMSDMMILLQQIQKVLDVPGSFLPKELKNKNMDHAVFGPMMRKTTQRAGEGPEAQTADPSAQGDRGALSEKDYKILASLRRIYTKVGSISREEFTGGESKARNWTATYEIAKEYVDIFFNNNRTPEEGIKQHIKAELKRLGQDDSEVLQVLETMKFNTNNNVLFPDAVAQWVVRLGKAMNNDLITERSYMQAMGEKALMIGVQESEIMTKLRMINGQSEMKQYIRYLQSQAAQEQGANTHWRDQYAIEKSKQVDVLKDIKTFQETIYKPNKDELKAFRATTIEGLAFLTTMAQTGETMDGKSAAAADGEARVVRGARNRGWAKELGKKGADGLDSVVQDRVREVHLEAFVRNYMDRHMAGDRANFDELALRLIEPERLAIYQMDGSNYFAYKGLPMDTIQALMKYDAVGTQRLLARIGENGLVAAEVFHTGSVRNIRELKDLVTDKESWEGRIGDARTMLRESLDWTIKKPIEYNLKKLATRRPSDVRRNDMGDFIASGEGGQPIRIKNKLLRTVMESAINREFNPAKDPFIDVKPMRRVNLEIPGVRELLPFDWEGDITASIDQNIRYMKVTNAEIWKDVEAEYRAEVAKKINLAGKETEGFQKVTAKGLKLNRTDRAEIGKMALERQSTLLRIMSNGVSALEQATIPRKGEKDFDNGLDGGIRSIDTQIQDMRAFTQAKKARDRAKKEGRDCN